jgi:hypothetical protein
MATTGLDPVRGPFNPAAIMAFMFRRASAANLGQPAAAAAAGTATARASQGPASTQLAKSLRRAAAAAAAGKGPKGQ